MVPKDSSQADFKKDVLDQKGLVFVDFHAEWCGPCKMTEPIIDQLAGEMKDVAFVKIDVDHNAELASEYSVFSIPTFMVFKDGKVVNQFVGAMGKEGFLREIDKAKSS
jgi:thioredoxin 1